MSSTSGSYPGVHFAAPDTVEFVRVVRAPVAAPPARWLFAAAMGLSTLMAVFGGLVLGSLAGLQTGYGQTHWTQAVQAHGRLQLFGWVSVFVVALGFEFIPRIHQRAAAPVLFRAFVLGVIAAGAIIGAAGQLGPTETRAAWPAGQALVAVGAILFAGWAVRTTVPRRAAALASPPWFATSAVWLMAASAVAFWAALQQSEAIAPFREARLTDELLIRGFVLGMVVAVGLRAFVGHLGLRPLSVRQQAIVFAGVNGGLALWIAGSGAGILFASTTLRALGTLAMGCSIVAMTLWMGILAPRGFREGPRYGLFARVAWVGVVLYAMVASAFAVATPWFEPGIYREGAIRHLFLLGFMAPLMIAMAHIVLARFGTGRVVGENWLACSFGLVVMAAALRVVPGLLGNDPGPVARGSMGLAGVFAAVGLAVLAVNCVINAIRIRQQDQRHRAGT